MGKKAKVGKARRDKFYHLAKETGFRARSAFKLIQLNRKFDFLKKSHVCIDLCAAPGGWMQVAGQYMPSGSVIIGVDLVPIKPIRGTVGIVADITTEHCRQMLRKELKHLKADVVLHDGAPNVGTAWIQDAFTQNQLVLKSLKLATEFLNAGGTFVTKIFRSRDYNSLMWVFQQLFTKCQATKPSSSRDVSAEIFVVCEGYLAPAKMDPKFLDPKFVFAELDEPVRKLNVFHPDKKERQRQGYEDDNVTQHKTTDAMDFIRSDDYLEMLAVFSAFTIKKDSELMKLPETTEDIILLLPDLKVLGKRDFKNLVKWRAAVRARLYPEEEEAKKKRAPKSEEELAHEEAERLAAMTPQEREEAELRKIELESANLSAAEAKKLKKSIKRKQKMKQKMRERLSRSVAPSDFTVEGDEQGSERKSNAAMFGVGSLTSQSALDELDDGFGIDADEEDLKWESDEEQGAAGTNSEGSDSDDEDALERQLEEDYAQYKESKGIKTLRYHAGKGEMGFVSGVIPTVEKMTKRVDDEEGDVVLEDGPLTEGEQDGASSRARSKSESILLSHQDRDAHISRRASMWFAQPEFEGLGVDLDVGALLNPKNSRYLEHISKPAKKRKVKGEEEREESSDSDDSDEEERMLPYSAGVEDPDSDTEHFGIEAAKMHMPLVKQSADAYDEEDPSDDEVVELDDDDLEVEQEGQEDATANMASAVKDDSDNDDDDSKKKKKKGDFEIVPKAADFRAPGLDPQGLAMATEVFLRKKRRMFLDAAYNRYAFNDNTLPSWFHEEEGLHRVPVLPVTKEMADEMRARTKEINERPIKKVLEAKARKKFKEAKKAARVRAQANHISESTELSEQEKLSQIASLYRKARLGKKQKVETTYVVSKKNGASKRAVRPKGVKGRYQLVDRRQKKEKRAQKRIQQRKKK